MTVRGEERVDQERADQIDVALSLTHPMLGRLFGYEGTVTVVHR